MFLTVAMHAALVVIDYDSFMCPVCLVTDNCAVTVTVPVPVTVTVPVPVP